MTAPDGFRVLAPHVFDSRDCVTRACPHEAERGSDQCASCLRRGAKPGPARPARTVAAAPTSWPCKTPGCDGTTKVRMGWYAYLCDDCSAAKRERMAAASRRDVA